MKYVVFVVCTFAAFAAQAQGRRAAQAAALETELEASRAQETAAAVRPGDEDLTCEQLQAEVVATAQNPDLQAGLGSFAAQAQADQAQVEGAVQQIEEQTPGRRRGGGGGLFRSLAQGAAAATLPNSVGASAQTAAAAAQAAQMQQQAEQNQQRIFESAGQVTGMMGPTMRGQRVLELAAAKECEFLTGGDSFSTPEAAPEPAGERARRR